MNGIRCAIWLELNDFGPLYVSHCGTVVPIIKRFIRRFGSHSEAKRELKHWIDAYPGAKIVDEVEL